MNEIRTKLIYARFMTRSGCQNRLPRGHNDAGRLWTFGLIFGLIFHLIAVNLKLESQPCQLEKITTEMATVEHTVSGLKQPGFLTLDGNIFAKWQQWIRDFEIFMCATGLDEKSEKRKVNSLLHCLGKDCIAIFESFDFENDANDPQDRNKKEEYDFVVGEFENYFSKKKRLRQVRREFSKLKQEETENVITFINRLKIKVKECDFGDQTDEMILDRLCEGVKSERIAERLCDADFAEEELTLEKAVDICRQVDMTEEQLKDRKGGAQQSSASAVHAVGVRNRNRGRSRGRNKQNFNPGRSTNYQESNSQERCGNCGLSHDEEQVCPAAGSLCYNCGFRNHWARCCRQPTSARQASYQSRGPRGQHRGSYRGQPSRGHNSYRGSHSYRGQNSRGQSSYRGRSSSRGQPRPRTNFQNVNALDGYENVYANDGVENVNDCENDAFENDEFFVYSLNSVNDAWNVDLNVHVASRVHNVTCKIDTQAQVNVLSETTVKTLGLVPQPTSVAIRPFKGATVRPLGQVCLKVTYKQKQYLLVFQVVEGQVPNLLGDEDSVKLGLIKRVNSLDETECVKPNVVNENVPECKDANIQSIVAKYSEVFKGLGTIPGSYKIEIDPNVQPVVHPPRKVPVAIRTKVKSELDKLEESGIITKTTEPSDWVSSLLAVTKGDKVRICIDPKDLNVAIKRSHYPLTTIEDVVTRTEGSKVFGTLDCSQGFFQIALDDKSSRLTTFNTPWGRYRYLKLPMGLSCSPEVYQMAMVDMLGDIDGVEIVMDDILIHAVDLPTFERRLETVLKRCKEYDLRLNPKKTKLGLREVDWIGHKITDEGVKISENKVKAILQMPSPTSVDEVRRLLGMINYLSKFIHNLSDVTAPIRVLLKKDIAFYWDKEQEASFQMCKKILSEAPVLKFYSSTEPVVLSCDASSKGLGAVLLQNGQPVAYASKALTDAEKRYAQIEKELLGIVFACKYFHYLIYGRDQVTVETDHKPLELIWKKPLVNAPMRLQKMLLRLQPYSLNIVYKKGKDIPVPDALSRLYLPETGPQLIDDAALVSVVDLCFSSQKELELRQSVKNDPVLQTLSYIIVSGWPEAKSQVPDEVKPYWDFRDELTVDESGLIFRGHRVVVPKEMRGKMLQLIHQAHLGIVKCKKRARDILFWPGMGKQIEDLVSRCSICQNRRSQQAKEPLLPTIVPDREWQKVACDLFELDREMYIILVDYFSEYFEVGKLQDTKSVTVIQWLKEQFARFGIVQELVTDGASYFSSREFQEFTHCWQFKHTFSSPTHSQSNGMAERSVGICKQLFMKAKADGGDPFLALLDNRNVPRDRVLGSPVQRFLHRRTQTLLPMSQTLLRPKVLDQNAVRNQLENLRNVQKNYYDRGSKPLEPLKENDFARIYTENGWKPGRVVGVGPEPRSYKVLTESGRILRRNRRHLLKTPEPQVRNQLPLGGPQQNFNPPLLNPPASNNPVLVRPKVPQTPTAVVSNNLTNQAVPPQGFKSTTLRSGRVTRPPVKFKDYVVSRK